jgi:4-carboxymuconolactone decarboxylase
MRLQALTPAELTPDQRALYDLINGGPRGPVHVLEDGSLQGPFNAMLHQPTVGTPLQLVGAALRYDGVLPPRARELAILTVARAYDAEFEWYAHAPIAIGLGVPEAAVEAIRRGDDPELGDEHERAVVDLARLVLDRGDLDDAAWDAATDVLTPGQLVELTTLVGYYATLAMQMRLFRVPLPDGVPPALSPD